eukprot:SM000243S08577  [mRNA]  locus=s243:172804:175025:+ [translate_table: standard]
METDCRPGSAPGPRCRGGNGRLHAAATSQAPPPAVKVEEEAAAAVARSDAEAAFLLLLLSESRDRGLSLVLGLGGGGDADADDGDGGLVDDDPLAWWHFRRWQEALEGGGHPAAGEAEEGGGAEDGETGDGGGGVGGRALAADGWRDALREGLLRDLLHLGRAVPGLAATGCDGAGSGAALPASIRSYVDTIGRFQRLVAGLDGSPDALMPSSAPPGASRPGERRTGSCMPFASLVGMGQCSICREALEVGARARMLPCRHLYHGECIALWLRRANTCPVCRHELPADDLGAELARLCRLAETGGGSSDSSRGLAQPLAMSVLDPYL